MTSPTGSSTLIPYIQVKKHGTGDEVNTYYCRQEQCYLMYALVLPHLDYSSSIGKEYLEAPTEAGSTPTLKYANHATGIYLPELQTVFLQLSSYCGD